MNRRPFSLAELAEKISELREAADQLDDRLIAANAESSCEMWCDDCGEYHESTTENLSSIRSDSLDLYQELDSLNNTLQESLRDVPNPTTPGETPMDNSNDTPTTRINITLVKTSGETRNSYGEVTRYGEELGSLKLSRSTTSVGAFNLAQEAFTSLVDSIFTSEGGEPTDANVVADKLSAAAEAIRAWEKQHPAEVNPAAAAD